MSVGSSKKHSGPAILPIKRRDRLARYAETKQRREFPMFRKSIAALALGAAVITLAACNTVKGLGRDIESVGEAGDRAI